MINRKLLSLFLVFIVFLFTRANAQKILNEASISYEITIEALSDKTALAKSLEGATLDVFIKGPLARTDMVSALGTETNIYDSKSGKGTILKQYSGQKLMITLTRENWMQKNQFYQNLKFNIGSEIQTINGFKCKKATGQSSEGNSIVIYFTQEITLANKQYENSFGQLPGLPIEYEIQSGKLKFKYSLKNVNYDPVPAVKFEVPKSGFRVMTYEENQQLRN